MWGEACRDGGGGRQEQLKKWIEKTVVAINIKCFISIFSSPIRLQFVFIREIKHTVYLICQTQTPPPHTALTCCTVVTCFSKELMYIFPFIETLHDANVYWGSRLFPLLIFSTVFFLHKCVFVARSVPEKDFLPASGQCDSVWESDYMAYSYWSDIH